MPILIPSKNIYDYVETNKISDNKIETLILNAKKAFLSDEKESVIFDENCEIEALSTSEQYSNFSSKAFWIDHGAEYWLFYAIARAEWRYNATSKINKTFSKYSGTKLITDVFSTKNDRNTDPKINYSGYVTKGNLYNTGEYSYTLRAKKSDGSNYSTPEEFITALDNAGIGTIQKVVDNNTEINKIDIISEFSSNNYEKKEQKTVENINIDDILKNVEVKMNYSDIYSTEATATFPEDYTTIKVDTRDKYEIKLELTPVSYFRRTIAKGGYLSGGTEEQKTHWATTLINGWLAPSTSEYDSYSITNAHITLYGNAKIFNIEDEVIQVGKSTNKSFSVDGSELMQDSVFVSYDDGSTETEENLQTRFGNTLKHYENGKEIYVIMCDFNEYYDEQGTLVKSTKSEGNMSFDIDDEVIPFVRGADGKDRYLSFKKDGQPKSFYVKGTEIIYDGACWQKLYLQEV